MVGTNDTSNYEASPRSTDPVYLPSIDGAHDIRGMQWASAFINNDLDADADVTLEGAAFDDETYANPVAIASQTVTAGESALLSLPMEDLVAYVRVEIIPATAPSSGTIEAKYHVNG